MDSLSPDVKVLEHAVQMLIDAQNTSGAISPLADAPVMKAINAINGVIVRMRPIEQGPEHPATDQDVSAAHKLSARVEEVERPQPKNEPPLMITDEDREEASVIGYLGPQTLLLELLAAHRRMKREAYALLAQKDIEIADLKAENRAWDILCAEHLETIAGLRKLVKRG